MIESTDKIKNNSNQAYFYWYLVFFSNKTGTLYKQTMEKMNTVLNNMSNSRYFNDTSTNVKLTEIKKQLDGPSDKDKLECMKKLIAMISKGRDVSEVFPQVVKNVIAKNLELKKLVYMYLVHYAESEHESALLAINTFQKSLVDKSQVIRASALRVMSSIRVVDIIQLLNDNSTMVLGAAMMAFVEVCPDRYDILHQHYRKICQLLADFDEWSQTVTIGVLTKYARTQFKCPDSTINDKNVKQYKKKTSFYSDEEDDDSNENQLQSPKSKLYDSMDAEEIDIDHRLLLKSCLPLLQSRSNAVVMAVSSLYYYIAPVIEAQKVGKSLVRLLRSSPEVQYITLTNISTMVTMRPNMFEPYLSEFFIHSTDPEYSIKLKLEILTRLATGENISRILKEFKEYVRNEDKKFAAETIQAIGRCAATIPDVTESCTYGLMSLLSNSSQVVVAEAVIVLKRLLQLNADNSNSSIKHENVIMHLAKLLETLEVPSARASIIWVIGEYSHKIPMVAPDVLRKLAKSFADEDESVKLQILNLGAKLHFHNPEQTKLLFQYIINQAKFDMNYDIRDSARMMKLLLISTEKNPSLSGHAKSIFINQKPFPTEISISEDRKRFILGSFSHIVNHSVSGYQPLSDFPEVPPDPTVRQPKQWVPEVKNNIFLREESFYSDEEEEDEDEDEEFDGASEEEDDDDEDSQDELEKFFSDSSDSSTPKKANGKSNKKSKKSKKQVKQQEDNEFDEDMDDMDELFGVAEEMEKLEISSPTTTSVKKVLLKANVSQGLLIEYCFLRQLPEGIENESPSSVCIQLLLKNQSTEQTFENIKIGNKTLIDGADIKDFDEIASLEPGATTEALLFVTFNSLSQACKFEISTSIGNFPVALTPIIGEMVSPLEVDVEEWKGCFNALESKSVSDHVEIGEKLLGGGQQQLGNAVLMLLLENINLQATSANQNKTKIQFAAKTIIKSADLFINIELVESNQVVVTIRSSDTLTATLLLKKQLELLTR
ncbi:beta adaptin [Heterostelium album PN500]|uniref:AP-3 complex subunit beta n=1 Tax=Heterostelium pallidum (strain ATCC 26659 / Pp 5 / PN500) TaxID=670386 RepID=D3BUD5_HETP5|nr:beta adaptin [Heterostelium album PN500]EFA74723.1 beta adaptin [Heterostelium album PN500]|eukprot:XP_020426857.1 beta adaptin [Heterostelium album PN500]